MRTVEQASISRQFARWAAGLRYEDLPQEVVMKVKALVLHALTGAVLGANVPQARSLVAATLAEEGKCDGASVLLHSGRATRVGAAFANAELIHASNLFDSYRMLTHPGPVLVPVALANAELEGRSGRDLIVALAAGYEFVCRLCDDFIPSTAARGFRPSPIYATLGAALVAGKLLGLDEDGLVCAIALGANFASGLNEGPRVGGNEMAIHEPQAARNGAFAGMMARAGHIRGAEHSIEGRAGFYNAFAGSPDGRLSHSFTGRTRIDPAAVTLGLGDDFKLLSIMFRMYPCAGYNQPVIELIGEMMQRHGLRPDDVAQIRVAMNWIETLYPSPAFPRFDDWDTPRAGESTHYYAAHAAVHGGFPVAGGAAPGQEEDALLGDPRVLAFMPRVTLVPETGRPMFSPHAAIVLRDGAVHEATYPYARMAWGFDTLAMRLRACLPGYGPGAAAFDAQVALVREIEHLDSVAALLRHGALQDTMTISQ